MKKRALLILLLFLPAIVYIYFALGVPRVKRAPFYGPRTPVVYFDSAKGKSVTDTSYYRIPAFSCLTTGGLSFSSESSLNGRSYLAVFLPKDSISTVLPILAQDVRLKRNTYWYSRFVFFLPTDSGQVPSDAPDFASELKLGRDTAFTLFVTPAQFDSLRATYFIATPGMTKPAWETYNDAVLVDRLGRIRGYYNVRFAAELKRMKEDVNHILLRDEGVQTIEESTVEQKREP